MVDHVLSFYTTSYLTKLDIIIDLIHLCSFWDYVINFRMALNKERALCFAARLLCTMAKGEKYSECTHDAEAILAHYWVDKPFKRFYQL